MCDMCCKGALFTDSKIFEGAVLECANICTSDVLLDILTYLLYPYSKYFMSKVECEIKSISLYTF